MNSEITLMPNLEVAQKFLVIHDYGSAAEQYNYCDLSADVYIWNSL